MYHLFFRLVFRRMDAEKAHHLAFRWIRAAARVPGLRAAIAHYRASPGPVIPHRIFGPLTKDEWDRLQLIHLAHHLSFAVPR